MTPRELSPVNPMQGTPPATISAVRYDHRIDPRFDPRFDPMWDEPEPGGGVRTLAAAVTENLKLIAIIVAIALFAGLIVLITMEPVYRADTLLQINERTRAPAVGSASGVQTRTTTDDTPVSLPGEVEILRSRDIVLKAIDDTRADVQTRVANRFPVIGDWYARTFGSGSTAASPPFGLSQFAWGGERLEIDSFEVPSSYWRTQFTLTALPTENTNGVALPQQHWLLRDEEGTEVARGVVGGATRFTLDGEEAVLNVARITGNPGTQFTLVKNSKIAVYENLIKTLRVSESQRQSGVVRLSYEHTNPQFAAALLNGITQAYLSYDVSRRTIEAERSLNFLETQLPDVKRRLDQSEDALNEFRTRTNLVNVDQESESLLRRSVDLERQRVELQLRYDQLTQKFEPRHPELQSVNRQLAQVNRELSKSSGDVNQLPRQQRDFLRLQREVQLNSQLYTSMLNNAQELRVARAGMIGNARLIDRAVPTSRPIEPRAAPILSVAAGLGLLIAICAALLRRVMRPTVRDIEDVERQTGLPTLASIPESPEQRSIMRRGLLRARPPHRLLALKSPDEPAVESLRSLRTSLALNQAAGGNKVVLITAATTDVGKSFVACNLAVLMAAANRRVLLLECDLRAPRAHLYFGLPPKHPGMVDTLLNISSLDEAVRRDVLPNLDVLLPGMLPRNPSELLLSAEFERLIARLSETYDHIVIDSAPVLPVGDTLAIGRVATSTFVVVRAEESSSREVRDAIRRLNGAGVNVDGLIFNGVKRSVATAQRYDRYFAPYRAV